MQQQLASVNFCSYSPEGDSHSRSMFKKQFTRFKQMNKLLMKRLKTGEINNLLYEEKKELGKDTFYGVWSTDPDYDKISIQEEMEGVTFV